MSLLDPVLHRLRAAGPHMTRHSATGHRGSATPPTGPSAASSAHGSPAWGDWLAGTVSPFRRNPVVYRCVRMIAEAAAAIPLNVQQ